MFLSSLERFNKLYRSKECIDKWIKSYEKIFDELTELPLRESTKEIFGNYMEIPDIYSGSFLQMSKLFKRSYAQLCMPLNESMMTLSDKMAEISGGNAGPEAYKEFYDLWVNTYNDAYGNFVKSMEPKGEMFENFEQSTAT